MRELSARRQPTATSWQDGDRGADRLSVFICHASEDKPAARALYQELLTTGFSPWLDEQSLLPGQDWELEIRRALRQSHVVLVCLSPRSVDKEGFLQKEIRQALDVADEKPEGTIFVVPIKLEECAVPDRLRRWHWLDRRDPSSREKLTTALRARAQELGIDA